MPKSKANENQPVERGQVRTMKLPVELTHDEIFARGEQLARIKDEHTKAQTELADGIEAWKETKKGMEVRVSTFEFQMRDVAKVVRSGREDRDVEVYDEFDFKQQTVFTKRVDTDHVVASRGMTQAERQRSLFKAEGKPEPKPEAQPEA